MDTDAAPRGRPLWVTLAVACLVTTGLFAVLDALALRAIVAAAVVRGSDAYVLTFDGLVTRVDYDGPAAFVGSLWLGSLPVAALAFLGAWRVAARGPWAWLGVQVLGLLLVGVGAARVAVAGPVGVISVALGLGVLGVVHASARPWFGLSGASLRVAYAQVAKGTATRPRDPAPSRATAMAASAPAPPSAPPAPAPAPPSDAHLVPGALFLGKYEVERELGGGAFGTTWLALHRQLGRPVVIKRLHASLARDPEVQRRFEREGRILARLDHARVTRVHDVEPVDGVWHIVMEYVDGGSLEDRLRAGPLPAVEAGAVTAQVLDGLAHVHRAGIVHRDLKPANILLTRDGHAKLADFGIAKGTAAARSARTSLTLEGGSPGTPLFMAPEQLRGASGDERSDLFAVAATFYLMVTGRSHLGALPDGIGALHRLAEAAEPDLPVRGIGRGLNQWLRKGLAREPEARFQDADAMAEALGRALAQAPAAGPPASSRASATPPRSRTQGTSRTSRP